MPAVYENRGIRFLYPENWSIMDEEPEGWPRSVTVQSEHTSFWSLHVYPAFQETGDVVNEVVESIREVYPDLEVLPANERYGVTDTQGVDICFFYLDLLVEAKIRCLKTPSLTLVWHYQAESREFDEMEPVFQAMATSLLETQVAAVGKSE
jgi:hypothetical protein